MSAGKRSFGLDVLRAAAIIGVLLCHGLNIYIRRINITSSWSSGVELFFVLSGFLIGRICLLGFQAETFSFWSFWRARWWRTLPPYFAAILLYLAARLIYPPFPPIHAYYLVFLQNYLEIAGFAPSWSLCVEEHFYLCLPILLAAFITFWGMRSLRYLLPALFFVPLLLRLSTYLVEGRMPFQWYWLTHLHFEGLIAGVWLAYLTVVDQTLFNRIKRPAIFLLPLSPLLLIIIPIWDPRPMLVDLFLFTIYAIGFAAWVRYLCDMEWAPVSQAGRLIRSAVVGTALCSYSVYLTHTIFDPLIRKVLFGGWERGAGKSVIVLALTCLGGVIFYFVIERPTILSRDAFLRSKAEKVAKTMDAAKVYRSSSG